VRDAGAAPWPTVDWAGRVAAIVVLACLGGYLAQAGLTTGSEVSGCVTAVAALAALVAPYLLPVPEPSGPAEAAPDSVEDSGDATATGGGHSNTGVQRAGGPDPARVTRSGEARAEGPGSVANTGIQRQPGPGA
jgi:hypothetical protein